jgi:hypothetical protein
MTRKECAGKIAIEGLGRQSSGGGVTCFPISQRSIRLSVDTRTSRQNDHHSGAIS